MDYPNTYLDAFRSSFRFPAQFIFTSQACNIDSNLCVISYPADKYLYTIDLNTSQVNKFWPSAATRGEITPEYLGVGYIIGFKISIASLLADPAHAIPKAIAAPNRTCEL